MISLQKIARTELENLIQKDCEDGLQVLEIKGKGRGVVATKPFSRGSFIVEYKGDLIDMSKAKNLEKTYSRY